MRKLILGRVGVIVLLLAVGAYGDVVSLPLNCAGYYDINTPAWNYDFDLGVTFSDISHVYIDWSGEAKANLYSLGSTTTYPMGSTIKSAIDLGPYPQYAEALVGGGMSSYPDPESFNERSEFQLYGGSWSDIYDGRGNIVIGYYMPTMPAIGYFIEHGWITLNDSSLVIEGTIIPEPATFLSLGTGMIAIITRNRRRQEK